MQDEVDILDVPGAAILWLDPASGDVLDYNDVAASMLGVATSARQGAHWTDLLGIPDHLSTPLTEAIETGVSATLPPFLVSAPHGKELVAGASLLPRVRRGRKAMILLLRQLEHEAELKFTGPITATDILVVLGVDRLAFEESWGVRETARFMIDIRLGLLQIVPARSVVGLPAGTSILIVLRDLVVDEALDICRALLSHLQTVLAGWEGGASAARVCLGLAQMSQGLTPLATILAANGALLHAQLGNDDGRISIAGDSDFRSIVAQSINAGGLFSGNRADSESLDYLAALSVLVADPQQSVDYLVQVCDLTLGQPGVAAVALYRRRHDDSYEFVAGGLADHSGKPSVVEKQLPRTMRQRVDPGKLEVQYCIAGERAVIFPLRTSERVLGYMVLGYQEPERGGSHRFTPGAAALYHLAAKLSTMSDWRGTEPGRVLDSAAATGQTPALIEGYVSDNMEGAIDQAIFLAGVDMPVAVIGPRGTGKLYVAKVIHQESDRPSDQLVLIDCRDFRSRKAALVRIAGELEQSEGKTLVFKSPHLMNPDAQLKLARQISSRILADSSPPRYLPAAKFIALFPDTLEHLISRGGLQPKLASVFAGYPISIPPLKDRKRAVIRWAHKILGQESTLCDRKISGFTPDAEQAMRQYDWPGNISEMREAIAGALRKSDKEWITPVDLGIFKGISPDGTPGLSDNQPFLTTLLNDEPHEPAYVPFALEELDVALAESLHTLLELDSVKPLGAWLDDELVLAVCDRYRGDTRGAARFLHTSSRNIGRWMPKILSRDQERNNSLLWQGPRRLIKQWIRGAAPLESSPQQVAQDMLMFQVLEQCDTISVAERAGIMGVSVPTYQKRVKAFLHR